MEEVYELCKEGSKGHNGFIVIYKKDGKEMWNRVRNMDRLSKFLKSLKEKKYKFSVYRCNNKEKMDKKTIEDIINTGKLKKEKLVLDE